MLQDIRKSSQGTTAKIIIGIIILAFAGFGVESILLGGGGNSVAEVNGEDIGPGELQQAIYTQRQRIIAMMGDNLDPAMLDEDRLSGPALEALIGRKLLTQSAAGMELAVSEAEIGAQVASMQEFQVNGQFSPDLYKSTLASAGYTPASFKRTLSEDILVNQIRSGLAGSEFSTPAELALNARILAEQRDLRYMTVPRDAFVPQEEPSEDALRAWYEAHASDYRTKESIDIEYIELSEEDFYAPVEESLILQAYEEARMDYQYKARSKVSHILFTDDGDAPVAERVAAARARLDAGAEFAEVAAEFSDDVGSAGFGGDLGYTSGDTFPAEMEAAISQLQPGQVSSPVQTEAGTHLLLVTAREDAQLPPLEEMRPELEARVQQQEAAVELLRTVETLRDISFNADDLATPAAELGLELATAKGITRDQSEGLFANDSLQQAAWAEDVLLGGHNSDVIEIPGGRYVALRVEAMREPRQLSFSEVREDVVARVVEERTQQALDAAAAQLLAQLREGRSMEALATERGFQWQVELGADRRNTNVPFEVLNRSFELPENAVDRVYGNTGDVMLVEVVRVSAGDYESLDSGEQRQMQRQTMLEYGAMVNTDYERGLRESAEIETVL